MQEELLRELGGSRRFFIGHMTADERDGRDVQRVTAEAYTGCAYWRCAYVYGKGRRIF